MKIGNVTLPNNIILAPMAGVTDLPFRVLCAEQGAGMVCMEMISAKALSYHNKNTEELLHISPKEGLVSLQLFGSEPELMGEMAKRIEERPFAVLDINMGCPVPKIVNNGEGSALMKNPLLAGKIIEAVAGAIKKPVTVKIRRGFDNEHENAAEIAHIAQESGAAAVTVHGRTREQYYAGEADLACIRAVKQAVRIPVIGNGDVADAVSAARMLAETGCDGVMVGRAARGNPWIFAQIVRGLSKGHGEDCGGFGQKNAAVRMDEGTGKQSGAADAAERAAGEQSGVVGMTGCAAGEQSGVVGMTGCAAGKQSGVVGMTGCAAGEQSGVVGMTERAAGKQSGAAGVTECGMDELDVGIRKPDRDEVKRMMLRHARMLLEEKGEYTGVREMRKHVAWYTAGYPNSAAMRRAVNEVTSFEQLEKLLDTIW